MNKILVSACLLGDRVRYDGSTQLVDQPVVRQWMSDGRVVSVCPEVSAGMSVPRDPAEISTGVAADVLSGTGFVIDNQRRDVTRYFLQGAENALSLCKQHGIKVAVLTDRSPSCGSSEIYRGDFSGVKVKGLGVVTALLVANGVQVFSQYQLDQADAALRQVLQS